jgi:ABC-type hemin transport system substrate-binding protein
MKQFKIFSILLSLLLLNNISLLAKRTITLGMTSTEIAVKFLDKTPILGCDSWSKGVNGALGAVDLGEIDKIDFNLIKELKPEIIIVDYEFSLFGNKEKLQELGIKFEILPNIYSKEQTIKNIEYIAKLTGKPNTFSQVVIDFKSSYSTYEVVKNINTLDKPTIYLDLDNQGNMIIAGKGTVSYEILKIAGNKINFEYNGWTKITKEQIEKLRVEFIIIPYKIIDKLGGNDKAIEFFKNTKSGKEDKVIVLEDWKLRNFGIYSADILLELVGTLNDSNF